MCGILAVGLGTCKGWEMGGWMFVLHVEYKTNVRSKLFEAQPTPKH